MLTYNPKEWFSFIFKFHKADTFRQLYKIIIAFIFYCVAVIYIEKEFFKLNEHSLIKNLSLIHSMLGFVMSMLLIFRTNTAYDRWWEGRKLWGQLTNTSRNLALKINVVIDEENNKDRDFFRHALGLFPRILMIHLARDHTRVMISENEMSDFLQNNNQINPPAKVVSMIFSRLFELKKNQVIDDFEFLSLEREVNQLMEICGACERIKNTPIPFSYSLFIKKFIFIYTMTLPLAYGITMGYISVFLNVLVFYVLASLEIIAEEIEDPFNLDDNDVPTDKISENIKTFSDHFII
ncbi:MAG: hypothetical protein MUE53_06585 [Chitinophagales bacterium]|jgi:putative membrane protein|nr:hypothetical protein [Chitinophagales bacterium]